MKVGRFMLMVCMLIWLVVIGLMVELYFMLLWVMKFCIGILLFW